MAGPLIGNSVAFRGLRRGDCHGRARGQRGAAAWRNRDRQRSECASDSRRWPAQAPAVRGRSTARRFPVGCSKASCSATNEAHSRAQCRRTSRTVSGRRPRHAVPGRSRRSAAGIAAQTAPGAPGATGSTTGQRWPPDVGGRASHRRNQPGNRGDGSTARFSRRSVYRLNVFPIRVPPLRERAEDIPLLTAHFVRRFAERHGEKSRKSRTR